MKFTEARKKLVRRARYLADIIAASPSNLDHDRAELEALRAILEHVTPGCTVSVPALPARKEGLTTDGKEGLSDFRPSPSYDARRSGNDGEKERP